MKAKKTYEVKGRIWVDDGDYAFLGDGRIELLLKVAKYGSLRKAAESMGMSYKKAWLSVKKINNSANEIMVQLERGGVKGGKAYLTPYAKNLIEKYEKMNIELQNFLKVQNEYWSD